LGTDDGERFVSLFKGATVRHDRAILAFFIGQVGEMVKVAALGKEDVSGVKRMLEVGREAIQ